MIELIKHCAQIRRLLAEALCIVGIVPTISASLKQESPLKNKKCLTHAWAAGFLTGVIGLISAASALVTNGYFYHAIGTKDKGLAGAGMAMPEDAISVVGNPAMGVLVGNHTVMGLALHLPYQNYTTTASNRNGRFDSLTIGPNDIDNGTDSFLIPHIASSWLINDKSAFTVALYRRGHIESKLPGGTATFDPDGAGPQSIAILEGTFGGGDTRFSLQQNLLDLTYSRQLGEGFSVGAGAVLAVQSLKVSGLEQFATYTQTLADSAGATMPTQLSNNGSDRSFGVGAKVGAHWQLSEHFAVGLSYQSKISMGKMGDYADLLPSAGKLDVPAHMTLGITWSPTARFSFSVDAEQIWYSKVAWLGHSLSSLLDCPTYGGGVDAASCLGGKNGPGFGWSDVFTVKGGIQWRHNERWTWRLGASRNHQPVAVEEVTWNILALDTTEVTVAEGFTRAFSSAGGFRSELSLAVMYAEEDSITGPNFFDPTQNVIVTKNEWEIEVGYGWHF